MYQQNQQQPPLQATVTIQKVESRFVGSSQVFSLSTDQGRFSFWQSKKDGSDTKAYEQFKQFNFKQGDTAQLAYDVTESGNNPHTGQPFQQKNIKFFFTKDKNTPVTPSIQNQVQFNGSVQSVPPVAKWAAPVREYNATEIPVVYPQQTKYSMVASELPSDKEVAQDLMLRVQALEDVVRHLEKEVTGHGTLLVSLRGQEATDLHTSFPVESGLDRHDIEEHFNPNN